MKNSQFVNLFVSFLLDSSNRFGNKMQIISEQLNTQDYIKKISYFLTDLSGEQD